MDPLPISFVHLILASTSPRRSDLLKQASITDFKVVPSQAHEIGAPQAPHYTPLELVLCNARLKGREVASRYPAHVVLAADTLVSLGAQIFGKPVSLNDASDMLKQLSGKTHQVWTGVSLCHLSSRRSVNFTVKTDVTFRRLSNAIIKKYIGLVNPLDKAGAYGFQQHGEMIVSRTNGSLSNIIGLPIDETIHALRLFSV
ncbi:MAG: Maf family protein [Verrucomicrobiota bacterium]|nr:Maf family protein [Verrucomicrobiota bacterium]